MLKADLRLQSIHYPPRRTRPTGMLKLQLTLLLQLNRCRGHSVCYKNANRVTPTRPFASCSSVTGRPLLFLRGCHVYASGRSRLTFGLAANVDHGARRRHEPRLADMVAGLLVIDRPADKVGHVFVAGAACHESAEIVLAD